MVELRGHIKFLIRTGPLFNSPQEAPGTVDHLQRAAAVGHRAADGNAVCILVLGAGGGQIQLTRVATLLPGCRWTTGQHPTALPV